MSDLYGQNLAINQAYALHFPAPFLLSSVAVLELFRLAMPAFLEFSNAPEDHFSPNPTAFYDYFYGRLERTCWNFPGNSVPSFSVPPWLHVLKNLRSYLPDSSAPPVIKPACRCMLEPIISF